ncbi:MAG: hypothetical protein ACRERS_00875 [Methylococcales bacterium]
MQSESQRERAIEADSSIAFGRLLALCERRVPSDWRKHFGYPLLFLETFVDPRYFQGTIQRAANGFQVGNPQALRGNDKMGR